MNIKRPKVHFLKEIYKDYARQLLEKNPTWWGKYEKKVKLKDCYIYSMNAKGKPVLRMSWYIWKEAVSSFYHKAKDAIIQGETLVIGSNVGKIRAIRVERNFEKPVVDWGTTFRLNLKDEGGNLKKIYYTDEDYCRIAWQKYDMLANETYYRFDPAEENMATGKGFKAEFVRALRSNPLLKFRYKYYPIKTKTKKEEMCSTDIVQ